MLGTIVNTVAVLFGASIGLLIKKGIPKRIGDSLMKALGLRTIYIGISGAFKWENTLVMIISMVLGTLIGEAGDNTMLYTKSTLDFCSSIIFGSTLGIGVLFAGGFVLVYQGGLTLLAIAAAPLLSTAVINEMTCVGSLVIIATGLNLLGITKLKLMNYIPAMFLPIVLCQK